MASSSCSRSIGVATSRWNVSRFPSRPGVVQSSRAHRSERRFSTGVPGRAKRARAGMVRMARAVRDSGFLMAWASSATNIAHGRVASASASRRAMPYVQITMASPLVSVPAAAPVISSRSRFVPW